MTEGVRRLAFTIGMLGLIIGAMTLAAGFYVTGIILIGLAATVMVGALLPKKRR